MTALHLVNSMPGYIILMMGTDVITIYIFLQFFENLSPTLDESAILDGCTYFGVFFKILLPLLKPAIVTSATSTTTSAPVLSSPSSPPSSCSCCVRIRSTAAWLPVL